ncbi:MAG: DUF2442 domain-containing protein [Paludibacter sp.]|jgi:hypothetical protein|nr:DUF2442 domain-containing protein [Paludibacter sp.]
MKQVKQLWFSDDRIFIETDKNGIQSQLLHFFPRLATANDKQRNKWNESFFGLHWNSIEEDINFESFSWADNDTKRLYHVV